MRIARFTTGDEPLFGIVTGDLDEYGQPDPDAQIVALAGDPIYAGINPLDQTHRLADVRLLAPVIPRSKVVAIGKNYADHVVEMGGATGELPPEPLMFLKPNTSVIGPGDPIFYPRQTQNLHYEGELAVVIGRICRDVPPEQATDVIYGYTIGNDVTARDLQKSDGQWSRAKGFDTFCPLGPWIETEGAFEDALIETRVDGELRQSGRTSEMVHSVAELIAFASRVWTLLPGDVILTGTPAGVGPFTDGQVVEVSIEGIGTLSNPARARA